jgi:hypothetical protein
MPNGKQCKCSQLDRAMPRKWRSEEVGPKEDLIPRQHCHSINPDTRTCANRSTSPVKVCQQTKVT